MKRAFALAVLLSVCSPAQSGEPDLHAKLALLEQRIAELEQTLAETARTHDTLTTAAIAPAADGWWKTVKFYGRHETNLTIRDRDDGTRTHSNIHQSTAEFGLNAQVSDWVGITSWLFYEDTHTDNFDIYVDGAIIKIADPEADWYLHAGLMYLPVGKIYAFRTVTDPVNKDLIEHRNHALLAGYDDGRVRAAAYAFNSTDDFAGGPSQTEDRIRDYGITAGLTTEVLGGKVTTDFSYTNNILDSWGVYDRTSLGANATLDAAGEFERTAIREGMYDISLSARSGPLRLLGEYSRVTGPLGECHDGVSRFPCHEPITWFVEADWHFPLFSREAIFIVSYQETHDMMRLPDTRKMIALISQVVPGVDFGAEFSAETLYNGIDQNVINLELETRF